MSDDYAVETIDRGFRLPILYNMLFSFSSILFTIPYVVILVRVLPPLEFLFYSSIFTFYTVFTLFLTRMVVWASRDYIRFGVDVERLYRGIYTLTLSIGLILGLLIIHYVIKSLDLIDGIILSLYGFSIIIYSYVAQLIVLVAPRFFSFLSMVNQCVRLLTLIPIIYLGWSISYITPLTIEVMSYLTAVSFAFYLVRDRVKPKLYIPAIPSMEYVLRTIKLSTIGYINLFRYNVGNIHYFIGFFMGLSEILLNILWIVYRVLDWGRGFFRGFQVVVYQRSFYKGVGEYDFKNFFNMIIYILIPILIISIVMHRPITSIFNPKYTGYSYLIPLAITLVILEVVRIALVRIVHGGETLDREVKNIGIDDILASEYFKVSYNQFKYMLYIIIVLIPIGIYLLAIDRAIYIPYIFISAFLLESLIDNIILYKRFINDKGLSIDISQIFYFIVYSIPSTIYLYYIGGYNFLVKDIFPDIIPIAIHIAIAYGLYLILSLSNKWVRNEFRRLINFVYRIFSNPQP